MNNFQRRLAMLIGIVAVISGLVIYFTVDINTLRYFKMFRLWSLGLVLVLISVGMYFDGARLMHLVRISGESITLLQAVQVIFGNYFLALLTPGATGGVLAQVLFLQKAGVPVGKATVLVIVRTLLSIFFLLFCMPVVFHFDSGLIPWVSSDLLRTVSALIGLGSIFFIWLLRSPYLNRLVILLTRRLTFKLRRRIFALLCDARRAAVLLSKSPMGLLRVFLESALSLIALYSIVPVLFMGIGASIDWLQVIGRMIFLNFLLYFAPTPGGSGIAEGGFIFLFESMLPPGTVGILAVVWRIFSEYLPFMAGLIFSLKVFGHDFFTKYSIK